MAAKTVSSYKGKNTPYAGVMSDPIPQEVSVPEIQLGYAEFFPNAPVDLPIDKTAYRKAGVGFHAPDFDGSKRSNYEPRAGFTAKLNPPTETRYGKSSAGFHAPDFDESKRSGYEPRAGFTAKLNPPRDSPYGHEPRAGFTAKLNPPKDDDSYSREPRAGFTAKLNPPKNSLYSPDIKIGFMPEAERKVEAEKRKEKEMGERIYVVRRGGLILPKGVSAEKRIYIP